MKREKILLWEKDEYQYEAGYGFVPFLMSYIHEDNVKERPCVIVVPGGGYCVVSPSEGEIVAKKFYEMGCNAFVCIYTTNLLMNVPLKNQPMKDLSRTIRYVRKRAKEYAIDPEKIIVCGFSAGAHLCGCVCEKADVIEDEKYDLISCRPNAAILSYPVITAGKYAHRESFLALLGDDASVKELDEMSLEKHVDKNMPPCFIWQTATDELVSIENSFLFASACKDAGALYTYHVFSEGPHGMSLANKDWAEQNYGEPYTMEQIFAVIQYFQTNQIPLPEQLKMLAQMIYEPDASETSDLMGQTYSNMSESEEVQVWPELVQEWLRKLEIF